MKKSLNSVQTFEQGATILFISGILVKIIGAFFKIPLSSDYCLGDIGFGYFSSVYDIYLPIYTLASTGIPSSLSRIISEYLADNDYENASKIFGFIKKLLFIIGIIGTAILLILAFPFIKFTDKTGNTFLTYLFMCPAVLFCFISSPYKGYFEGNRNMIPTAVSNIIDAFSKVLLGFTFALFTVKSTGNFALSSAFAMGGIALGTLISYLFLRFYKKSVYNKNVLNDYSSDYKKHLLNKLYKICIPIILASFAINLIPFIDSLTVRPILGNIIDSKIHISDILKSTRIDKTYLSEEIPTVLYGIKSKSYTIFNLVPVFSGFIASSALPSLTNEITIGDNDKAYKTANTAIKLSALISFPLGCGLIFVGTPIMNLLFGDNSSFSGGIMLSVYGLAALFAGLIIVFTSILQASKKQNKAFLNIVIGLIIKLFLNFVLVSIPSVNIYGSVISTLICFGYIAVSDYISISDIIKIKLFSSIFKPLISAMICGISAFAIVRIIEFKYSIVFGICVAGIVYLIFLYILKAFSLNEFKEILGKNA